MSTLFKVEIVEEEGYSIYFHPKDRGLFGLRESDDVLIHFGIQKVLAKIRQKNNTENQGIYLSSKLAAELMIPLTPLYECKVKNDQFYIGPIIGIVTGTTQTKLSERVRKLGKYVKNYANIGGAIIAFCNEKVDFQSKTVEGYLYNPVSDSWIKGRYPFPIVIFKKSSLNKKIQKQFSELIGNRIFYSKTFNKWEMYTFFENSPSLKKHLPETKLLTSFNNIFDFVDRYGAAYVKPIKGMQGKKIAKVMKMDDGVKIIYINNEKTEEYMFTDLFKAKDFFRENIPPKKYVVQQPLNLKHSNESIIDFRVILVKDENGEWKNFGMMGRNGVDGHIVSNRHRGGRVEVAHKTLQNMFGDEQKVKDYLNILNELAVKSAHTIENCGYHFGKLGVDIGIDVDGRVWLIEINHRNPNDFVALFAGDKNMVNEIRYTNMLYAKWLSEF